VYVYLVVRGIWHISKREEEIRRRGPGIDRADDDDEGDDGSNNP
jgi:hypothetical protein